jgi:Heavy metal associated domain 2
VVAGSLRTETDPKTLVALLDDRIDLDLRDLRTGAPRALDYANVIDALLARAELEGISHQEIEATRVARIAARGSFRGGIVWTPPEPVFHIVHEVSGRVRLEAAILKGDAAACAAAEACLVDLPGIRSAQANSVTGSLTVIHDGSAACRKTVMRALERFSCAPVAGEVPHPVMAPSSRKLFADSIATRVAKVGLEQAVSTITERAIQIAAAALL